jgi:hypothetical protein
MIKGIMAYCAGYQHQQPGELGRNMSRIQIDD